MQILSNSHGYTAPLTRKSMKTLVGNVVGNHMLVQPTRNNWNFSGLSDFNANFPWLTLSCSNDLFEASESELHMFQKDS